MTFQLGQPFKPFQQLMGVLPDRSKSIVPTAFWELMTSKDSPIIDFYPRDFELDMNGKKQEWEAVVKIPFIDEARLLPAMASKEHLLSTDEKSRNGFGPSLQFTYKQDLDFTYVSSLPGHFPDIEHCHCVENIFELPTMDGLHYRHGLMDGVKLGVEALAGFPSLKTLPYAAHLGFHGVNVFQQDSRNESMVLTLEDSDDKTKASHAQGKLGKAVFVNYPFLLEAKVVKVIDELFDYEISSSGQVIQTPHGPRDIENFKRKADRIESEYSKKLGMIIGGVESLAHIEPLKGVVKQDDGATVKDYGEMLGAETLFAPQTIVDSVVNPDPRFVEKAAVPVEEEFPVGTRAFFLGDFAYGRPLEVVEHDDKSRMGVWVSVLKVREPEFGHMVVMQAETESKYVPAFALANSLQLNPLVLSKLTSSLSVESSGLRLNLGLNMKFEGKKMKVLGYSRKGAHGWEYSPAAITLIHEYMMTFPQFIAGIAARPKGDIYKDTDFYEPSIAKDKIKEIGAWLKSKESKSFEKVPLDAEQLDSEAVRLIQDAAEQNLQTSQIEQKLVKNIPRHALLNPADADQRIGGQRFSLGDRVVYVLNTGRVPIAQRGTVIGLTRTARQTWLDVAFDTTYMGGTTLGDRCRPFSGTTVPSNSVLNLSQKQIVAMSAASSARKPAPSAQPLDKRSYGGPAGLQLRPAQAPPPLQGSFRGALGGQPNGYAGRGGRGTFPNGGSTHFNPQQSTFQPGPRAGYANTASRGGPPRGRGGAPRDGAPGHNGTAPGVPSNRGGRGDFQPRRGGRGGYHQGVDIADPYEGVVRSGQSRPTQSYNNVPPPADLENQGGRGGRGRGGRGRGRGRAGTQQ